MSDEREERLKKLDALRALNSDPFGKRFDGTPPAGELVARFAELENKPACVSGRVTALRSMGKAAFLDVRDWTGKIQVHAKKDKLGDSWAVFENVHIGDLVAFNGLLGKSKTGEIRSSPRASRSSRRAPAAAREVPRPDDPEIRFRQRYLTDRQPRRAPEVHQAGAAGLGDAPLPRRPRATSRSRPR
jgi:lysyl-tRNA synthetase class 2